VTAMPQISVLIPTFRRPHLLRRAIESTLNQTYRDLQVCIYDNASGDETAAVVAEFAEQDARVKYYCHQDNIGMSPNFMFAMQHVETPFFSFLSDDDFLLPNYCETILEGFECHPEAMISSGETISMTEHGQIVRAPLSHWKREGCFYPPEGLLEWTIEKHPPITGTVFRREVIEHVGLLDPDVLNADFDYEWRIVSRFPYVISKKPCMIVYIHEGQETRSHNANAWAQSYLAMRKRLGENDVLPPDIRQQAEALLTSGFAGAIFLNGLIVLRDGNFAFARTSADVLHRVFHEHWRSSLLRILTRSCESIEPLHHSVRLMFHLLLWYRTVRNRRLKKSISASLPA
jgi:glycosyltransferase involved in cell wall biosynthesis